MPKRRIRYNIKVKMPRDDGIWVLLPNAKAKDARNFMQSHLKRWYNYPMEETALQHMLHDFRVQKRRRNYCAFLLNNIQIEGIYF